MAVLSIGVAGAGLIGRAHIDTILASAECTLAGVADPTPQGKAFAESRNVRHFTTVEALIAATHADGLIVATPNDTHLAVAAAGMDKGIPVLVEKPITATLDDAAKLVALSQARNVPVLVGHHRRHNPIIRQARALICEGRLGRIIAANVLYTFFKPPGYFDVTWRRQAGGGPVLINLIHEIDLVRHLCGEIGTVQAMTSNASRDFEVEDTAGVLLHLVNGAIVTLTLTDTAVTPWSWDLAAQESPNYPAQPAPVQTHFLCGDLGSLTLPTLEFWSYRGEKSWFAPISHDSVAVPPANPYHEQLAHFCAMIRGEVPSLISADDGMRTLRATLAVHDAARSGRSVTLT